MLTVFWSFVENLGSREREKGADKESHVLKRLWHICEISQPEKNNTQISGRQQGTALLYTMTQALLTLVLHLLFP